MADGDLHAGIDILLSAGGEEIGGQRDATLNLNSDEIDASHKKSGSWGVALNGIRTWSIDADNVYVEGDTAQLAIWVAFFNRTLIETVLAVPGGITFTGNATVQNIKLGSQHKDAATFTAGLRGRGALVPAGIAGIV
jgi:predicted secreted protein